MKNLIRLLQSNPIIFFILAVFAFFYPFVFQGKIPIPADTIVGMYHPFRDVIWDNYTAGVPFKNFLITDPVRQQYVWRNTTIEELKNGHLPFWNPYSFSGTPLHANFQGASFYPLNILFLFLPFYLAWSVLIILQPMLAGIFLYCYLRYFKISKPACLFGALVFVLSGFSIAWLEWNTVGHVVLWTPLILLSIEKLVRYIQEMPNTKYQISKIKIKNKVLFWALVFTFSVISSFFAGHLQIFFYNFFLIITYIIIRILSVSKDKIKPILLFLICFLLFVVITSVQWLPTLQFISESTRNTDQGLWMKEGWFIPWQHLIQFIVPDFFGNPATGNYWGIWNYGEFIGYIGLIPLILAIYALYFRHDKKTFFFGGFALISLIFALPTPISEIPYIWQFPLISTSQPTRLLGIADFSLSILAALGLDYFLKNRNSAFQILKPIISVGLILVFLWLFVLNKLSFLPFTVRPEDILVAQRNLIFPSLLFVISGITLLAYIKAKNSLPKLLFASCLVLFVFSDLFRFGWKFTPFSKKEWIFPKTKIIEFIKQDRDNFRIMPLDRRILPPNFSAYYKLQDVSGYDPLYLTSYAQLVSAWERNKPDITLASFNRIVTPTNYENFITDLLSVKYLLSLSPVKSEKLEFVAAEGTTYLYKNKKAFPRAFLVEEVIKVQDGQEEIEKMFLLGDKLRNVAVTTELIDLLPHKLGSNEMITSIEYRSNFVKIKTKTNGRRLLVLTDQYYPSWKVYIDGKQDKILRVNFALKGVIVPEGEHLVEFKNNLI